MLLLCSWLEAELGVLCSKLGQFLPAWCWVVAHFFSVALGQLFESMVVT